MYTISTTTTTTTTKLMTERPSAQPLGMDVPTTTNTYTPSLFQGILKLPSLAFARARGMLQWALPYGTVATDNNGKACFRRGIQWTGESNALVAVETCVFDKTEPAASIQPAVVVPLGVAAPSCLRGGGGDNTTIPIVASRLEHGKRFEVLFGVWEDFNRDNGLDDRYLDAATNELFFDGRLATLKCTIDELEYYLSEILPDGLLGILFDLLEAELLEDDEDDDDDDDDSRTADDGEQTNTSYSLNPTESEDDDDDEFAAGNDGDDDRDTADDDEQANSIAITSLNTADLDDDDGTQTGNDVDDTQTGDGDDDNDNDGDATNDNNDGSITDRSMEPSPVWHTSEGYGSMYIPDSRYPTHVAVRRSCRVAQRQLYTPGMYKC